MRKVRMLIVDDAVFIRNIIKKSINSKPSNGIYEIEIVGETKDGKEAVTKYFDLKPDVVTMDINMPEINGVEATKLIMSKDKNAKIIVITGNIDENIKNEIMNAGALYYMKKPINNNLLWKMLDELFIKEQDAQKETETTDNKTLEDDLEDDLFTPITTNKNNLNTDKIEKDIDNETSETKEQIDYELVAKNAGVSLILDDETTIKQEMIKEELNNEVKEPNNDFETKDIEIEEQKIEFEEKKNNQDIEQENVITDDKKIYYKNEKNDNLLPFEIKPPRHKLFKDDNIATSQPFDNLDINIEKSNNNQENPMQNKQQSNNLLSKIKSIFKRR